MPTAVSCNASGKMQLTLSNASCRVNGRIGTSSRRQATILPPVNAVKDVFMPALSSTMTEGKIVTWLKNVGDKVTINALSDKIDCVW